jgi:hypothetical protein
VLHWTLISTHPFTWSLVETSAWDHPSCHCCCLPQCCVFNIDLSCFVVK